MVKNEFLAGLPRDGRYKALQAHYATMLEKQMTKDEILERYLNTVFFGNNAYGLQAAAEVYFGKNVERADDDRGRVPRRAGALAVGLRPDPPLRSGPGHASSRSLERLVDVGLVTAVVGAALVETWPDARTRADDPDATRTKPTYYTEALQGLPARTGATFLGDDEQERANLLYRGGLRIHTTFDPNLQALAEQAHDGCRRTRVGIRRTRSSRSTPRPGRSGRWSAAAASSRGPNEINMALVPRQTGSSIKFFILAAALRGGRPARTT